VTAVSTPDGLTPLMVRILCGDEDAHLLEIIATIDGFKAHGSARVSQRELDTRRLAWVRLDDITRPQRRRS